MQQLDKFMQHNGDGRDTHAMLQWRKMKGVTWGKEICRTFYSYRHFWSTYTYRKDRSNFVHAVPISPLTYIFEFLWVPWQVELLVHELGEGLHSVWTSTDTHKLKGGGGEEDLVYRLVSTQTFNLCNSAFCKPWCLQTFAGGRESWCSSWNGRECPPPWCPSRDFSLGPVVCKWKQHSILVKVKKRRQMVPPNYQQHLNKRSCLTPKLPKHLLDIVFVLITHTIQ